MYYLTTGEVRNWRLRLQFVVEGANNIVRTPSLPAAQVSGNGGEIWFRRSETVMQLSHHKDSADFGQRGPIAPTAYIELLKMSMPAEAKFVSFARHAVQGVTQQLRMDKNTAEDLLLAVGEACSNAVLYAGRTRSQSLSITCRVPKAPSPSRSIEIDIRNHGDRWAHAVTEPNFSMPPAELLVEHGRGLPLMHSLVDLVEVLSDGGDTLVRLTKQLA